MAAVALAAPGSADPRLRRLTVALMGCAMVGIPVGFLLRDTEIDWLSPIAAEYVLGAFGAGHSIAAWLLYDQAAVTGERTYRIVAAGCQFVAMMSVVWALTIPTLLTIPTQLATTFRSLPSTGALTRLSVVMVWALMLGISALLFRRDQARNRPPQPQPVTATVLWTTVAVASWSGVVLLIHALAMPLVQSPGWGVAAFRILAYTVILASIAMVWPSYRTGSILHSWMMVALVSLAVAAVCGSFTGDQVSVPWYLVWLFALIASLALLAAVLGQVRGIDREHRSALRRLQLLTRKREEANRELSARAITDPLTGLTNRAHFFAELRRRLEGCCTGTEIIAVAEADFDGFKAINDQWGHAVGDHVLRTLATRMRDHTRADDLVSRLGGDEFGLVFRGVADPDSVTARLEVLMSEVARPILHAGAKLQLTCSIGFALAPADGTDPDELLRKADSAMYQAKRERVGRALAYAPEMAAQAASDSRVRADVLLGLQQHRATLAYQPVLDLRHGGVWGFEALLRLTRSDGVVVSAGDFVNQLVAAGQVHALGSAVLDLLARDLPLITTLTGAKVSFNLSAPELADRLLVERLISGDLARYASRLMVEIGEATLVAPGSMRVLAELRAAGYTIAIDDYGSGLSNISLLEQADVGVIKVSGAFTRQLSDGERGAAVIRSAVSLAEGLDSVVVAKGVESSREQAAVGDLGVPLAQGYALGRPLTIAAPR